MFQNNFIFHFLPSQVVAMPMDPRGRLPIIMYVETLGQIASNVYVFSVNSGVIHIQERVELGYKYKKNHTVEEQSSSLQKE